MTDETQVKAASDAVNRKGDPEGIRPDRPAGAAADAAEDARADTLPMAGPGETADRFSGDVGLLPGAGVGDGRYQLLVSHGGSQHLQFWQALDTGLGRQVALTVVDPDGALPAGDIEEILSSTMRLRALDMPGIARVLNVARIGRVGLVVSEWIRGGSLREVADTAPSPVGVARAMQSLATAAEAAHRGGMALSIDHPSRVRVSTNGHVALAFPATMPAATPHDDVAGIGAALYTLLVNRWPLPQPGMPSGLARGEVEPQGRAEKPAALKPEIPFLISVAAAGAVRPCGRIQSAATVLTLLQQATDEADQAEPKCAVGELLPLPPPGCYAGFRDSQPTEAAEARHRKGMLASLGAGAAVIVVMMMLASTLSRIIGNGDAGVVLDKDKLGLHTASSTPASPATVGGLVKPVQATVFSPGGAADGPQSAGLAIDRDPATAWSTDKYFDAVPFPTFKDGVGLLLRLPQPTALSAVTVDLDSAGTVVQIRSSPSATPTQLADTTELTPPTPTRPGHNSIRVDNRAATRNVVVWISTLGTTYGESRSDISEITLQAASPGA